MSADQFLEAFLPLFVAINVIGILPIFITLTEGMPAGERRALVVEAATAALALAVVILFAGNLIFSTLGITLNDLRVGGGLILLILSIVDLAFSSNRRDPDADGSVTSRNQVGIVPLGIPLMVGPGAITTILVAQQNFGYLLTLASLVVNLGLVVLVFWFGPSVLARLGPGTSKAVAKVASLFLAAIAVAMIRAGIIGMVEAYG